jgi:ATP-binding cassette subfamily B multidrug efflux pump
MLIRLIKRVGRPYLVAVAIVCVFQFVQAIASLYLPSLNADLIDNGVAVGNTTYIWHTGLVMLAITVLQVACNVVAIYYGAKAAMAMGRDIRAAVFDKVEVFGSREMSAFGAPTLITRGTNDVQQIQLLLFMGLTILISAPITGIGGLIMALRQDVELSAIFVIVLPVMGVTLGLIIRAMRPLFRLNQRRLDSLNRVMREQISGVRVVRAFGREQRETERFGDATEEVRAVATSAGRLMALLFPTLMVIMNFSLVLALWWGGHRIADGHLQIGQLIAFQQYLIQTLIAVMMGTFMFMLWPRAEVSAERITEVLETEPAIDMHPDVPAVQLTSGRIELRGVSFAYPEAEADVLHRADIDVIPGETTAIVGSTGSGKSTTLRLMARLFDPTDGQVLFDGHDVRELRPEDVWAAIAMVPQRSMLFTGSVASNLRYGRSEATDDELWEALEIAQARDFVEALPDQLESVVTQGGTNFSGGQRQRLAIARAVVRRPHVYLFDDSFSALDFATDAALRRALQPVTRDAAVVIVAQRINTIRDIERIVVLDEGQVAGTGSHAELMAGCEVYREIVLSQMTESEAA